MDFTSTLVGCFGVFGAYWRGLQAFWALILLGLSVAFMGKR